MDSNSDRITGVTPSLKEVRFNNIAISGSIAKLMPRLSNIVSMFVCCNGNSACMKLYPGRNKRKTEPRIYLKGVKLEFNGISITAFRVAIDVINISQNQRFSREKR